MAMNKQQLKAKIESSLGIVSVEDMEHLADSNAYPLNFDDCEFTPDVSFLVERYNRCDINIVGLWSALD